MNASPDLKRILERQSNARMRNLTCISCKFNEICEYAIWLRKIWDEEKNNKIPLLEEGCTLDIYQKKLLEIKYEGQNLDRQLAELRAEQAKQLPKLRELFERRIKSDKEHNELFGS